MARPLHPEVLAELETAAETRIRTASRSVPRRTSISVPRSRSHHHVEEDMDRIAVHEGRRHEPPDLAASMSAEAVVMDLAVRIDRERREEEPISSREPPEDDSAG